MSLQLAKGLSLPLDVATQKLAWLGTTGSGKTYGAMKLAELMWDAGLQFVALDTMGIWYGLRISADQKGDGIPIVVFGGKHGDIPIGPKDGHLIADVVVRERISAVIDVSSFETDSEKARFGSDFADRLYRLKRDAPSAIHIFIEEAHEFIPQNPQPGEATMLHHFNRLWKQGRNYGIGGSLITQRPQDVNKKASELSAAVFAFNVTGSNAFDAVAKWMKGAEVAELPKLQQGHCLMWSPAWLQRSEFFKIEEKKTFHVSFDPFGKIDMGAGQRVLAPIAVEALKEAFAQEIEHAKENDVEHLKARIKELEKGHGQPSESAIATAVEKATAPLIRRIDSLESLMSEGLPEIEEIAVLARSLKARFTFGETLVESSYKAKDWPSEDAPVATVSRPVAPPVEGLSKGASNILHALATLRSLGRKSADRRVVAVLAGQSPKSGSYGQNLAALRREELIETTEEGLALTAEGIKRAPKVDKPSSLKDYHTAWKKHLSATQSRMLDRLIALHPKSVTRAELANLTNQSEKSGSFGQNLAKLRSFQLVEGSKDLKAAQVLFPEGLK